MTLSTDSLVDRRKLRRKLGYWRLGAVAAAAVAIFALARGVEDVDAIDKAMPHVARLAIQGLITGDRDTLDLIEKIGDSPTARAALISIDSPGGTTTGAERLYESLRRLSAKKPVVAVVNGLAASGGYIAALGADEIVAQGNALVGSIGVLFQYPNFHKLLDTVGVDIETIKSSPLKAVPNGLEPTSEAAKEAMADLVRDSYAWFKSLVQQRRRLSDEELAKVSDGRVFTARQGLPLKLVDYLGGEAEAASWLETNRSIAKQLPIKDWKKKPSLERLGILGMASLSAKAAGYDWLSSILDGLSDVQARVSLDGLVSIWQAPRASSL